jgi:hypothetical protein
MVASFLKVEEEAPSHILWEISTSSQRQVHEVGTNGEQIHYKEGIA